MFSQFSFFRYQNFFINLTSVLIIHLPVFVHIADWEIFIWRIPDRKWCSNRKNTLYHSFFYYAVKFKLVYKLLKEYWETAIENEFHQWSNFIEIQLKHITYFSQRWWFLKFAENFYSCSLRPPFRKQIWEVTIWNMRELKDTLKSIKVRFIRVHRQYFIESIVGNWIN